VALEALAIAAGLTDPFFKPPINPGCSCNQKASLRYLGEAILPDLFRGRSSLLRGWQGALEVL
jgi:hypothetical protein